MSKRQITVDEGDLTIAFNALVRSYNAKSRRTTKRRPSELVMELVTTKKTIDRLRSLLDEGDA